MKDEINLKLDRAQARLLVSALSAYHEKVDVLRGAIEIDSEFIGIDAETLSSTRAYYFNRSVGCVHLIEKISALI